MASVISAPGKDSGATPLEPALAAASELLTTIVEENAYVGEVYSLGYEDALVQIHDFHRQKVGGIPALSFLIANEGSSRDAKPILGKKTPPLSCSVFSTSAISPTPPKHFGCELRQPKECLARLSGSGITKR